MGIVFFVTLLSGHPVEMVTLLIRTLYSQMAYAEMTMSTEELVDHVTSISKSFNR